MKSSTVRTDGFYASGPVEWEDWHAGVHMRETHYHFWRFYLSGNWVCCHRYDPAFAFWQFTEALAHEDVEKAKRYGTPLVEGGLQLFVAGTYTVDGDSLTMFFEFRVPLYPSGQYVYCRETKWRSVDDCLMLLERPSETPLCFVAQPST
jgi:hypothetical protein